MVEIVLLYLTLCCFILLQNALKLHLGDDDKINNKSKENKMKGRSRGDVGSVVIGRVFTKYNEKYVQNMSSKGK